MEFRPSLKAAAIESSMVAILATITLSLLFNLWVGIRPAWLAIGAGVVAGVIAFAWYFGRYVGTAPRLVRINEDGLVILRRREETTCLWTDVRRAVHESKAGLQWRFELPGGSIIIRDDGFNTTTWDELSKVINAQLAQHGIIAETIGFAELFEDED